uniref:Peroxisomal membrane protein PEX14-like KPWE domain-containing protein n=1 Tax=Electrophorus electricus TaxID=8005 RepID=A0A4W4GD61_ELEEL
MWSQFVPLSFAEVFRMIQTGEEIPGLLNLDIKPCNQLPTVSHMSRKLKPWEKIKGDRSLPEGTLKSPMRVRGSIRKEESKKDVQLLY